MPIFFGSVQAEINYWRSRAQSFERTLRAIVNIGNDPENYLRAKAVLDKEGEQEEAVE